MADLLWVQTLLESDEEHYAKKDLNSWMYLRFLSISLLDPQFYENYMYGGLYLSIVKDDVLGAAEIYDKGLKLYPEDYKLNYYAGFNYYFELGNFEKGAYYLKKIQKHPNTTQLVKLLIGKLIFESSKNFEAALELLKIHYNEALDPVIKKKILSDIYSLKAEKDLKCLNEKSQNCERQDAEGKSYLFQNGTWKSPKDFSPYRIHLPDRSR